MNTRRRLMFAVGLMAALPMVSAFGQTRDDVKKDDIQPASKILKANDLIGKNVTNPAGERMGDIKDLVIDVDSGKIVHAALDFGGFLGMGDKLFAVPWQSLGMTPDGKKFTLDVPKDRLKNAPGFDQKHWPNMADRQFVTDVYNYYIQKPYWEVKAPGVQVKMTGQK